MQRIEWLRGAAVMLQLGHPMAVAEPLHPRPPLCLTALLASRPLLAAAAREEGGAWRMDLQQYAALTPAQRLSLLLAQLGGDSLSADLALHVAPFLSRLSSSAGSGGSNEEAGLDPQLVLRQVGKAGALLLLAAALQVTHCMPALAALARSAALGGAAQLRVVQNNVQSPLLNAGAGS